MFKTMNVFSKPSIQIIQYLGRRYRDGYYVREISRNLGIGLGSASQSLRTLEEAGLVLKEHKGRLVIYGANMQNFLLREFKILLTLLEIDPLISHLKDVSSRIIIFGSCASGDDTIDSDIDIFIESDNRREVAELHDRYQEDIPRKISPIILDASEFRNLEVKDRPLYERINMGKVIHEA
jgi:predicted nucleotidyltransferase